MSRGDNEGTVFTRASERQMVLPQAPAPMYCAEPLCGAASPAHPHTPPSASPNSRGGRLDAGHLEIVLSKATIRREYRLNSSTLTPEVCASQLDVTKAAAPGKDAPLEAYISIETALISEGLRTLLEDEPNTFVQERMRRAIAGLIEETILEYDSSERGGCPDRVPADLARLKTLSVPFEDSSRQPRVEADELREAFYLNLLDVTFLPAESSASCVSRAPVVTYRLPTEAARNIDFTVGYQNYDFSWQTATGLESYGGFSVNTRPVRSLDLMPVVVVKTFIRTVSSSISGKLVGVTALLAKDLASTERPFHSVCRPLEAPIVYELLPHIEAPEPVARFKTSWKTAKFLEDHGVPQTLACRAISRSVSNQGSCIRLDVNWALRTAPASPFCGEMYFMSRFVPASSVPVLGQHFTVEGGLINAAVLRDSEYLSHSAPLDRHGAPLPHLPYNPNLPFAKRLCGEAERVPAQWEFERLDYADIREKEQLAVYLEEQALWKWHAFLTSTRPNGKKIPGGEAQWSEIQKATQALGVSGPSSDYAWLTTINQLCGPKLPRFLVEVWCGENFVGELLLPKLFDLRRVLQTKSLSKLQPSNPRQTLSRPDPRKTAARSTVRAWISLTATWRCSSSAAGRLSLAISDIRDVATPVNDVTMTQPIAPRVTVYKFDVVAREWTEAMKFSSFEYALYFLSPGQAKKSMKWTWDAEAMGCSEPDWRNCFSWDQPGKQTQEEREVSIPLMERCSIAPKLKFEALMREHTSIMDKICNMIKNGVPSLMRPLVWKELSGANVLKSVVDSQFLKIIPAANRRGCSTAFEYLRLQADTRRMAVFDQIKEDVAFLRCKAGLNEASCNSLQQIMRVLCLFCSVDDRNTTGIDPPKIDENDSPTDINPASSMFASAGLSGLRTFTCERNKASVGLPVIYSRGLLNLAYVLMLDFDGLRFTNEDIFFLIYAMTGAGYSKRGILKGFFREYHLLISPKQYNSPERNTFADETPAPIVDATFVRAALEILLPQQANLLKQAGVHPETLLYGPLHSLFATYLPSDSLFRLWDLLTNQLMRQQDLAGVALDYGQLQKQAQKTLVTGVASPIISTRNEMTSPLASSPARTGGESPTSPAKSATTKLFDDSFGRQILVCLAYSLLARTLHNIPPEASSREIALALNAEMRSLRDPSEVIALIRHADFVLFTSPTNLKHVTDLWKFYIDNREGQMELFKRQNKLLQEIAVPWQELAGHDTPNQILVEVVSTEDARKAFSGRTASVGLATEDIKRSIYPAMKYHALFAPPSVRDLPRDGLGRILIKLDELKIYGGQLKCYPEVRVRFAKERQTKKATRFALSDCYIWRDNNIFSFIITTPPPYRVEIEILDDKGDRIVELTPGFRIKKLLTQGESYHLFTSRELAGSEKATLNVSWFMYTNSVRMFLPASPLRFSPDARGAVAPGPGFIMGAGQWGDLAAFTSMKVHPPLELIRRKLRFDLTQKMEGVGKTDDEQEFRRGLSPCEIRPATFGVSKHILDELLFHTAPALLPFVDSLSAQFGAGLGSVDEMPVEELHAVTAVPLRELMGSLIVASRGSVLQKASLLFDLFGQHEPQFDTRSGRNRLMYADEATPPSTEDFSRESAKLDPLLPEKALDNIRSDPRVVMNCISLSAAVACTQLLLRRCGVHVDNMEAIQVGTSVFDPMRTCPRLVAATISTVRPIAHVDAKHDSNNPLRTVLVRAIEGKDAVPAREFHELTKDVTKRIQVVLCESVIKNGVLGFDFSHLRSLDALGIPDPFPGGQKTLRIALNRSSCNMTKTEVISVEIDAEGRFWAGTGGNLKRHKRQSPQQNKPQKDRLDDASYIFDLRTTLLDKHLFLSRLLQSELLSNCLCRPSAMDRVAYEKPALSLLVTIPLSLDRETLCQLRPLSFKHKPKQKHQKRSDGRSPSTSPYMPVANGTRASDSGADTSGDEKSLQEPPSPVPVTITPPSPYIRSHDALSPMAEPAQLLTETVHSRQQSFGGSSCTSNSFIPQSYLRNAVVPDTPLTLWVTIERGCDLFNADTFTKMDPYCRISLGDYSNRTAILEGAGTNPVWNETFELVYKGENTLKIEIWDSDLLKDDIVGECTVSLADLFGGSFPAYADVVAPVYRQGKQYGTLTLAMKAGFPPKKGRTPPRLKVLVKHARDLSTPDGSTVSAPVCAVKYGTQDGQTQSFVGSGGLVDPTSATWNASFCFNQEPTARRLRFEVLHDNFGTCLIGSAVVDISTELPTTDSAYSGEVEIFDAQKVSRGFVEVNIRYNTPPSGPLPDFMRVSLASATFFEPLRPEVTAVVLCAIGSHELESNPTGGTPLPAITSETSRLVKSTDGREFVFNETLDFLYHEEALLQFRLLDASTPDNYPLGDCSVDLWDSIREGSTKGGVTLHNAGRACGRLNFSISFKSLPPHVRMPENIRVVLKSYDVPDDQFLATGIVRMYCAASFLVQADPRQEIDPSVLVSVGLTIERTETFYGHQRQGTLKDSTFNFETPAPSVAFEFFDITSPIPAVGRISIVDCLLTSGNRKDQLQAHRVALTRGGKEYGSLIAHLKLTNPPLPPPAFIKLTVHKIYLSGEQVSAAGAMISTKAHFGSSTVDMGEAVHPLEKGCAHCGNSVQFLRPYKNESRLSLELFIAQQNFISNTVGLAEIDLWDLLSGPQRLFEKQSVPVKYNTDKVGRVVVTVDCFDRSVFPEDILGIRCAIRSGKDLTLAKGDYFGKMDPYVVLKLTDAKRSRTRTMRNAGGDPDFMDEEVFIEWPSDTAICDELTLEVWDEDTITADDLLSTANLHIWDRFRDVQSTWVGEIALQKSNGQPAGSLHIALQLLCKSAIRLAIDTPIEIVPNGFMSAPFECLSTDLTVAEMKKKIGSICRRLAVPRTDQGAAAMASPRDASVHHSNMVSPRDDAKATADNDVMLMRIMSTVVFDEKYEAVWVRSKDESIVLEDTALLADFETVGLVSKVYSDCPHVLVLRRKENATETRKGVSERPEDGNVKAVFIGDPANPDPEPNSVCTTIARYPLAITSFPPVKTIGVDEGMPVMTRGPERFVDKATEALRDAQIEVHPGIFVSALNLGWVQLKSVGVQRGLSHLNLLKDRARSDLWVPCVRAKSAGPEMAEIVLLNFNETTRGYDDPAASKQFVVSEDRLLANFSFGADTPATEYDLTVPAGMTKRKITAAISWKPPTFTYRGRKHNKRGSIPESDLVSSAATNVSYLSSSGFGTCDESMASSIVSGPASEESQDETEFSQDEVSLEGFHHESPDARLHSPRPLSTTTVAEHQQPLPKATFFKSTYGKFLSRSFGSKD